MGYGSKYILFDVIDKKNVTNGLTGMGLLVTFTSLAVLVSLFVCLLTFL